MSVEDNKASASGLEYKSDKTGWKDTEMVRIACNMDVLLYILLPSKLSRATSNSCFEKTFLGGREIRPNSVRNSDFKHSKIA